MKEYDVIVIGGGPAGLAAAISAHKNGARTLLIEREERLGGILKQCIHDGFGLVRFGERLTGPEYAKRFVREFHALKIDSLIQTFVTDIRKNEGGFTATTVSSRGLDKYRCRALVLATGCRERTARQVSIHGTRPAGVFTAGTAQHFVNLLGQMPTKKCVILGSGDIGLIMARRLTLEGAEVVGVYEVRPEPSGLLRNIMQCLEDYDIPLHLSHTVTRVFGRDRLEGVEVAAVDENMQPLAGTEERIDCDALILSVGLIPENEVAEKLGVTIDPRTRGPLCDENLMTDVAGVFSCGNSLHVSDLVDYVTESGELAGRAAAAYSRGEERGEGNKEGGKEEHKAAAQRQPELKAEVDEHALYFRTDMRKMICITCPNSCLLTVAEEDGNIIVSGNRCPRGRDFAIAELTHPVRTISSTVRTTCKAVPVLPVRVSQPIPKEKIFAVMAEINKVIIDHPVSAGEILIPHVLGLDADVIAASEILKDTDPEGEWEHEQ